MSKREQSPQEEASGKRSRTTENNLTALYKFVDTHGNPPGTIWPEKVIQAAQVPHQKAIYFNEHRRLQLLHDALEVFVRNSSDASGTMSTILRDMNERIFTLKKSLGDFGPGSSYRALDIFRRLQRLEVPAVLPNERLLLSIKGVVELSKNFDDDDKIKSDQENPGLLYELEAIPRTRHEQWGECDHKTPPWEFWKETWDTGAWQQDFKVWRRNIEERVGIDFAYEWQSIRKLSQDKLAEKRHWAAHWKTLSDRLKDLIRKHAARLKNVNKIICFGLGSLSFKKHRCFVQHMAANTIAETLEELRRVNDTFESIGVLAQDPDYCRRCTSILKQTLKIETVTNFEGFLNLDQNTFVITFCPSGPVGGIIADLTFKVGGPAAMFCDRIDDNYMKAEYSNSDWEDIELTRNIVEYKKRCIEEDFGDAKDCMGRSWEAFRKEFPIDEPPAGLPQDTDEQEIYRDIAFEEYAKAGQSVFRDAWLYVKND